MSENLILTQKHSRNSETKIWFEKQGKNIYTLTVAEFTDGEWKSQSDIDFYSLKELQKFFKNIKKVMES
jgi:hypothetical protein